MAKSSLMRPLSLGGSNIKELAALLQSKGRNRDTILAHINPEEAALLKARGGSGRINPNTGLPEFDDAVDYSLAPASTGEAQMGGQGQGINVPSSVSSSFGTPAYDTANGTGGVSSGDVTGYAPGVSSTANLQNAPAVSAAPVESGFQGISVPLSQQQSFGYQADPNAIAATGGTPAPQSKGVLSSITDYLNNNPWATKLGAAGIAAIPGVIQAQKAKQQAQDLQKQYQTIAQPYQQTGNAIEAAGLRGELTPANQQAFQVAQAQALQSVANRGMVGGTAVANQLADIYNNLANQQITQGIQIAQIGDQYVAQGINIGIQANNQLNQSLIGLYAQVGAIAAGGYGIAQPKNPVG